MESILNSIKKMLGPTDVYTQFDVDIITHINTAFKDLKRLGVGPSNGFIIEDDTTVWTDFITDPIKCADAKTYVYLSVKLVFDPPTNSSVLKAMQERLDKLEWTMSVDAETEETEVI